MTGYDNLTLAVLGVLTCGAKFSDAIHYWLWKDHPDPPTVEAVNDSLRRLVDDGRVVRLPNERYALVVR